jgi:hypothetical protein
LRVKYRVLVAEVVLGGDIQTLCGSKTIMRAEG